jgi:hypothetical protein
VANEHDARRRAGLEETSHRLWAGLEKCHALVNEYKSALEHGTPEPGIFNWTPGERNDDGPPSQEA